MEINKRNRSELKSYFVTNAIPTEGNFADLVDGMLNQKEDGITKLPGSPLCIEAVGDETRQKKALHLYESFADNNPAWVIGMRPRVNPLDATTQKQGLGIMDSTGVTRLFIDRTTGNVGVGTVEPAARLHVAGDLQIDGALKTGAGGLAITPGQPVSGVQVVEFATVSVVASNYTGNAWPVRTATATFSQPVVKAEAVLRSFYMGFAADLSVSEFYGATCSATCAVDGNTVTVTATIGINGRHPKKGFNATFLVIAVLQNAV